jgi:hypothetical protein
MSGEITCSEHGSTAAAFVCSHMWAAYRAGKPPEMVCQAAVSEDPFPDAWCEACESEFQEKYDSLTDGFSPSGGLVALCTDCYTKLRDTAEQAGTLRLV